MTAPSRGDVRHQPCAGLARCWSTFFLCRPALATMAPHRHQRASAPTVAGQRRARTPTRHPEQGNTRHVGARCARGLHLRLGGWTRPSHEMDLPRRCVWIAWRVPYGTTTEPSLQANHGASKAAPFASRRHLAELIKLRHHPDLSAQGAEARRRSPSMRAGTLENDSSDAPSSSGIGRSHPEHSAPPPGACRRARS